jgi:outer membrane protein
LEDLVSKTAPFCAVAALVAALAGPAWAQQSGATTDKDKETAHVRELIQQAMKQLAPVQQPGAQPEKFVTPGTRVDLQVDEAVQRALDKNIDISVARLTPRTWDFTIAGLEATYRPNLTSTFNNRSQSQIPTNQTQGITVITQTGTVDWSSGFAQNLWWGGASYSVAYTGSRANSPSTFNTRNPLWRSGLTASYLQPLLRGFGIDSTRAALLTNRLNQTNDEIALRATISTTQASVRNAYWDLVFAIQAEEAAANSLSLATKLVQDNQARVEIGTLAPIDVVTAQAEEATRRQTLVINQATVRTAELALKRLIVSGTDDPVWTASINPTDRPPTTPEPINLEAAVSRALGERTDLARAKNSLQINDINLKNQVDLTKPQLNLNASYGLAGVGGTIFQRDNSQLGSPIVNVIPSGYLDALRNIGRLDAPTWNVGMNFAWPLGTSAAESNVARSRLTIQQSQAQMKALELQIATDVTNAALTVQSSLQSVQTAGVARELSQKRLEAAQSKYEVGMATNFEVVQAQRDLADAQTSELRSVLAYRRALVNFEQAQTVGSGGNVSTIGTIGGGANATGGTAIGGQSGTTGGGGGGGGQ